MLQLPGGESRELHIVIDVPHCLKNIRNALRCYNIEFGIGEDRQMARWDDIVSAYNADSCLVKQMRFLPKVGNAHINLTLGKKMSVRLAANVLSRSMAQSICAYVRYGKIQSTTAEDTACFCEQVKFIFNLCNNSQVLTGITADNLEEKVEQLKWCIAWMKSLKLYKRTGTSTSTAPSSRHNFMKAWQISLGSFISLAYKLVWDSQVKRLLTRQLTQDHVENGFSCIRRRGSFNDNPEYREARATLASLAVNSLLSCEPVGRNCEDDGPSSVLLVPSDRVGTSFLGDLAAAAVGNDVSDVDGDCSDDLACGSTEVPADETHAGVEREKHAYIAGYCLRWLFSSCCRCDVCRAGLQWSEDSSSEGILFVKQRQWTDAVENDGGLVIPSPRVIDLVTELEIVFYKHIEQLFTEEHLSAKLAKLMLQAVNVCDKLFVHDVEHASTMAEHCQFLFNNSTPSLVQTT